MGKTVRIRVEWVLEEDIDCRALWEMAGPGQDGVPARLEDFPAWCEAHPDEVRDLLDLEPIEADLQDACVTVEGAWEPGELTPLVDEDPDDPLTWARPKHPAQLSWLEGVPA